MLGQEEIATIAVAILTSNALSAFLVARMNKGKNKAEAEKVTSENWRMLYRQILDEKDITREQNLVLIKEIEDYRQKLNKQVEEIIKIRSEITLFKSFRKQLPIAWWVKDSNGIMREVSDEYERIFLIPNGKNREDYIGFDDIHVWGEEIGTMYKNHDKYVKDSREPKRFKEYVIIDGDRHLLRVEKVPIIFGDHIWGTMGYAYFDNWEEN